MTRNSLITLERLPLAGFCGSIPLLGNNDPLGAKLIDKIYRRSVDGSNIREGVVVAYHPQAHSARVYVQGEQSTAEWTCVFADEMLSYSFGYSDTNPPREGDKVLILPINGIAAAGVIVGRIPFLLSFAASGDQLNDSDEYHRMLFTQLEDTWDRNVSCYSEPFRNVFDCSTKLSTNFRPTDVYPGEFARVNQHNCGIKGGMFSATLLGGGASLRLSALANAARLTCESYIRHTLHGSAHEFHNGRFLSSERNYALYQEERLGGDAPGAQVWTFDSEAPAGQDKGLGKGDEDQTMRPRMKELTGYFGHLSSKFCLRPDPDDDKVRVQGVGEPKEAGVSRETIDPSGQYRLSAAGMLAFERTGRIPVPVRKCYPTDKGHGIEKDPEQLKAFEHDEDDPCMRQLELFDRLAYDLKNQYSRVDGLGTDEHDYDVPQEEDLKPLEDQYDKKFFKNETVKLRKYDKRRAGVYIGEDGSVIVRDAWGSEIVMLGGNIQLACAGNVMILPGKTQLTIAGDDIVHKAQNSVDIHASEHDVRLSAARNMEILGGGDEKAHSGGVIIESRGKSMTAWDGEGKGESAQVSGITLRTNSQGVVVDGQEVTVRSRKKTRLISGDEKVDGSVDVGARSIRARGKYVYAASEEAAMTVRGGAFMAVAKTIGLFSESGVNVMKGSETMVPMKWHDTQNNVAAKYLPELQKQAEDLTDEKRASGKFDREALGKMKFGFRTSEECGTDKPWAIGAKSGSFKMYEPAWAQIMKVFDTMKGVDATQYKESAEWENGYPFPGDPDVGLYVKLAGDGPVNLTEGGINKSRKVVKDRSEIDQSTSMSGYLVRKGS